VSEYFSRGTARRARMRRQYNVTIEHRFASSCLCLLPAGMSAGKPTWRPAECAHRIVAVLATAGTACRAPTEESGTRSIFGQKLAPQLHQPGCSKKQFWAVRRVIPGATRRRDSSTPTRPVRCANGKRASRVSGRNDSAGSEPIVLRPCHPERSRASLLFRRGARRNRGISLSVPPCLCG
jgi:hypothetical protein